MISVRTKEELLQDLALGKISHCDLPSFLPEVERKDTYLVESCLNEALRNRDALDVEFGLALLAGGLNGNDRKQLLVALCNLLNENFHFSHEDIATILKDIGDSSVVPCLYDAATTDLEYLEYDETFQLARKCIKALAAIRSAEAVALLRKLTLVENRTIADYATKELYRLSS